MITLYSYPELYEVADNNPFGLKVYAFLKLTGLPFRHEHIFDASKAPRGQLPYITDDDSAIGDSDTIIAWLIERYRLTIDDALTHAQRNVGLMLRRTCDDLYWVMSYSRWKDPRFWPQFQAALLERHPVLTEQALRGAREFNEKRYYYQGIGRFDADAAYARGIADLGVIADLIPPAGFIFGSSPCSLDAGIYGFTANIYFYDIETPLKQFLLSKPGIVAHCKAVHAAIAKS
jgi:glutathione S-transferase